MGRDQSNQNKSINPKIVFLCEAAKSDKQIAVNPVVVAVSDVVMDSSRNQNIM